MLKKPLALLITILVLASVCISGVFAASESKPRYEFFESTFGDISPDDDCYRFVRNVYENGLMNGKGHGIFDPAGNVTAAELITVAARLHASLFDPAYSFEKTDVWYESYRKYCKENGIFIPEYEDLSSPVTMRELAAVLSALLPDEAFSEKVFIFRLFFSEDETYDDDELYDDILKVCQSGILDTHDHGDGRHVFQLFEKVKRGYLAKVLSRIITPHAQGTYTISDCSDIEAGDYLVLGLYEQDNDLSDGTEPIEWLVLERDGNNLLIVSRYGLDCVPYNDSETDVTWETCSLRRWLNNQFMNSAFSSAEKSVIIETDVKAEKNPIRFATYEQINEELIEPGNDTLDMIFILSWDDINTNSRFVSKKGDTIYAGGAPHLVSRACVPTDYAIARGASSSDFYVKGNEAEWGVDPGSTICKWWIRNPGESNSVAVVIGDVGTVNRHGVSVNADSITVRPAMWVIISGESQK